MQMPSEDEPVVVVEGDCLEVLRDVPAASCDAIITDPPYGISFQSAWRTETKRLDEIANDGAPYVWWLADAARVLKPGGCLVCFCRWDTAEAFRLAIGWAGLKVGAQLVWDRVVHGLGDLTGRPAPQHDTIWFAVNGKYKLPGKRPTSVYRSMRLSGEQLTHPNEKPVALMRQLVTDYTREGAMVVDPFGGSGTTAVAALHEGRRCLTIEKDAGHCDLIRRRIADAQGIGKGSFLTQGDLFAEAAADARCPAAHRHRVRRALGPTPRHRGGLGRPGVARGGRVAPGPAAVPREYRAGVLRRTRVTGRRAPGPR